MNIQNLRLIILVSLKKTRINYKTRLKSSLANTNKRIELKNWQ
jgi:hypothetical protein